MIVYLAYYETKCLINWASARRIASGNTHRLSLLICSSDILKLERSSSGTTTNSATNKMPSIMTIAIIAPFFNYFCSAIQAITSSLTTDIGRAPGSNIKSWNALISNLSPNAFAAKSRNSTNCNIPSL
jgi:hypothetical protein